MSQGFSGKEIPRKEPQNEGLLENDLYLLTQGDDAGQDFGGIPEGRRPERSKRRKRTKDSHPAEAQRGEVGQMEPLALPAPADAEGHEAEPEAPGSEVPEASPTGDTPKEKVPQSPEELAAEMERARKRKKFESKPVEAKKEGDEDMDWIHFPSLAAAGRETGVPNRFRQEISCFVMSVMNLFRWSAFHLCFSMLVLPVLGQSSNMKIVIKPDQVIIIVVIVVIIFGVCCGVVTVACRNRKDLLLMAPEWMSFRRGPKIEEATEEDRIIFERAERRKQKRELREAAAADLEEGGGSGILDLPNTLPSPGDEKGDGQELFWWRVKAGFLDPVSSSEESLDTSLPQTSASGTDSAGSVRYARKHHRKISRSSDPGGDHSRRGRAPRPAALDDAVASDPLSRWKRSRERQPGEGTEEEDLPPSSSKARAGRGRRHSVSGASPELLSLASPGVASMGVGSRTFGRGMPTS
eukprot:symbB.v1.2.040058.t1/scaffold6962.1/size14187/1